MTAGITSLPTSELYTASSLAAMGSLTESGLTPDQRAIHYLNAVLLEDGARRPDLSISYTYTNDVIDNCVELEEEHPLAFVIGRIFVCPDYYRELFHNAGIGAGIFHESGVFILDLHWGNGPSQFPEYYTSEYRARAIWATTQPAWNLA